ncbi:FAD-binding domain-containing protein [Rheinheimera texasensis]|uniref:FAD-binding domain-containing protein n=1 Tax=Rheinheimera texasensis TaxID=306205 RepID=UPI000567EA41|nr:FAD-binding domain-containing protein [Rheinheimera texasensis]
MSRYLLFCNDLLRLDDNPLLCLPSDGDAALAVCILPQHQFSPKRASARRRQLQLGLLHDFQQRLAALGIPLLLRSGDPAVVLPQLLQQYQLVRVVAAEPTAPEEYSWAAGLNWHWLDANSLLADKLRPDLYTLPRSFTAFRQQREPELQVLAPQQTQPSILALNKILSVTDVTELSDLPRPEPDQPLPVALAQQLPDGFGHWQQQRESAVLARFSEYIQQHLSHYKLSRNALIGADFASFLSVPLSRGTLSVRRAWQLIRQHELQFGQNESSYWLRFELLWREYFRHLQRKHPLAFFCRSGLGLHQVPGTASSAGEALQRWQQGQTGLPFIDANMQLLAQTGWMSNRGRQNVASYLMFQLGCDWRHGAAWFEQQLLDYDVASNWGNWAYIAGALYSAPRSFNALKQAVEYDHAATFTSLLLGAPQTGNHRHQPYAQPNWPAPQAWQWQQYLQQLRAD